MADPLRFEELRAANTRRCEEHYHPVDAWSLPDWFTAAAGEMGELGSVIKNIRRRDEEGASPHVIGPTGPEQLGNEAADVVIYLDLLCARAGVDLGQAVRRKFNLVSRERLGCDVVLDARAAQLDLAVVVQAARAYRAEREQPARNHDEQVTRASAWESLCAALDRLDRKGGVRG